MPILGQRRKDSDRDTGAEGSYRNGYLLNFALSVRDSFIAEPDGYSEEVISELEDQYSGDGESYVNQDIEEKPTIIVVMSESYADLSVVGDFLTNEQVTPYYDSLQDNIMKDMPFPPFLVRKRQTLNGSL